MKIIIIDDEAFARQCIKTILNKKFPEIEVVGEAESIKDAIKIIKEKTPDLVFLDIDLTDGTGFELLHQFDEINFKIIFVTAHNEFAIKAIKFSALDYLLKPVDSAELENAINKAEKELNKHNEKEKVNTFIHNLSSNDNKKIVVNTADKIHILNIEDIIHCESKSNYTILFLNNGTDIIVSKSIKSYSTLLEEYGFVRVHRSHLINIKYIEFFDKRGDGFILLNNKTKIPVSSRNKQSLLDTLSQFQSI